MSIVLCLGLLQGTWAQSGRLLRFTPSEKDLGEIRFDSGKASLEFEFQNISQKSVTILEVRTTCGCLTGSARKSVLAPSEKSVVDAVFDPSSLYGDQSKHLTIVSTDGQNTLLSSITVKAKVKRDQSEGEIRYAELLGSGLRTDTPEVSFKKDRFGDLVVSIPLYNDTDSPVEISFGAPLRISVIAPNKIAPRSRVDVVCKYNSLFRRKGASIRETLRIKVNGDRVNPLTLKGKVY